MMENKYWEIDENKTQDYCLELNDLEFKQEECWPKHTAIVKWGGCIHYNEDMPEEVSGSQYIHICDIDHLIARLVELRKLAFQHFKDKYPEEWKE